uniref:Uncharacterized protein n=1 Tax=Chaetoceros debilis TaxID=122233 RepID=A0A7S3VB24_9STRA
MMVLLEMPYVIVTISGVQITVSHPFLDKIIRALFLIDSPHGDYYLSFFATFLFCLCLYRINAFSRPPPVQRKLLPRRPALQILFKPDDISSTPQHRQQRNASSVEARESATTGNATSDTMEDSSHFNNDDDTDSSASFTAGSSKPREPIVSPQDLPDGFAPLLSSSQMELMYEELTADLLHASHVQGSIRIKHGRHEIPLDKDNSRPQLIFDIPKEGCKLTAVAALGSDGFSSKDDLDVTKLTKDRSLPMVKHAGVTMNPPIPLLNVAPTLIHFPTLFEDNVVKYTLRRLQIVRYIIDIIKSISSFIEKVLWILESKCQIHLGKVSITPIYKGAERSGINGEVYNEPQWRLSLAFSGHAIIFGWIPIPFVNIALPTWIIPHPHALLQHLLSSQPLASGRVNREKIAEKRIIIAILGTLESWDLNIEAVATPPALSVDLALPGGITMAVEAMHGTDVSGGRVRGGVESVVRGSGGGLGMVESNSNSDTLSSCTMFSDNEKRQRFRKHRPATNRKKTILKSTPQLSKVFDANSLVPWKFKLSMKGEMDADRIAMVFSEISATHDPISDKNQPIGNNTDISGSKITASGKVVICRPDAAALEKAYTQETNIPRKISTSQLHTLALGSECMPVAATILYPYETTSTTKRQKNLLKYDYSFDIGEDTSIDAVSLSVGASHPMLKGGTIITTILESIYAHGSLSARDNSILNTGELKRKRNILKHLPAVDFTAGIQNIFIPEESMSYSDDAQTKCIPELFGGQMMVRVTGGFEEVNRLRKTGETNPPASSVSSKKLAPSRQESQDLYVSDGINVLLDFGIDSVALNNQTNVNEFPELDIFGHQKLISTIAGSVDGTIGFHLRPQDLDEVTRSISKNFLNPLEAYEIDFSGSNVYVKISEANATLGHRRLIIPSETTIGVHIVNSIVDMSFDGNTETEVNWDFQGSSPILQKVEIGLDPGRCLHEEKESVNLLIYALRQGRFNLNVSSVGGLTITQAVTTRANREGLYDWKFFNAIVSPDDQSAAHILKVLHDKITMSKLLQVVKLINGDLERVLSYIVKQAWRAKEIFDSEGVSDPGHAIPGHKMARLLSMFLCGDASQVNDVMPIVLRVVQGDGLDVMKTKELLQKNLDIYENYAPEIDRATRWAETMFGSIEAPKPFVEKLGPLSLSPRYLSLFTYYPTAKEIYDTLSEKCHLPLDPSFSAIVSTLAPYLSFPQIEYILQVRPACDWQPVDLRRLRYVYSVKKKVLEISESYGGLSFMPQSFFVSVFVGEATRGSLRAWSDRRFQHNHTLQRSLSMKTEKASNESTLHALRRSRRTNFSSESLKKLENFQPALLSPAGRIASVTDISNLKKANKTLDSSRSVKSKMDSAASSYEAFDVGDSLLGPEDVAILLQAGLTSSMKGSTVVQLNQRMLLDLMASQPRLFSIAVLCEIGNQSARGLTSALLALLDLDQSSFREFHRLDMHQLMESWLPGLTMPQREDYLAGGRWARLSYYDAIFSVASSILEEAEVCLSFKSYIQLVRHNLESDPIPTAKEITTLAEDSSVLSEVNLLDAPEEGSKLALCISRAKEMIAAADEEGLKALNSMHVLDKKLKDGDTVRKSAVELYHKAFEACRDVLRFDKLAFHAEWLKSFYRRNFDALMVKSVFDNIDDNIDDVREWMTRLNTRPALETKDPMSAFQENLVSFVKNEKNHSIDFMHPEKHNEQDIIDAIINLIFFDDKEKMIIKKDPLARLLIGNPNGDYDFTIISAMGVITEGKNGLELDSALQRLKNHRGVDTVRADTGTARSLEYNATQIQAAIDEVHALEKPYGLLGYSQGCPNSLLAESLLLSGSPSQQEKLTKPGSNLVCRQLLFSAANGSMHGPATEAKIHRLIVMCESFFKYQQGYCSRAFIETVLSTLTNLMDSSQFQKFAAGGGRTFLHEGCRSFWREAQHLPNVPTCCLRGVMEENTTPESLEMISNLLTKVAGSHLHDSQVHVYDAVGRPVYTKNRNAKVLEKCEMGGAIQRTHHWSPLEDEVKFVRTQKDIENGTFLCAKDRHVFPWVDVNARFGFIKYTDNTDDKASA